jgi:hypothetical protein
MANKLMQLLRKVFPSPATMTPQAVEDIANSTPKELNDKQKSVLAKFGQFSSDLTDLMMKSTMINFERIMVYRELDRSLMHWMVGSAAELYADYVTTYDKIRGATVWITSENKKYETELNNLLQQINIEEKIYDWTYTTGVYGDLFVKPEAIPGMGIIGVNDDEHPMNISRLDKNVLLGFYRTPIPTGGSAAVESDLLPPWEYIHFRILGSRKRRSVHGDPLFSQFSSVHFLSSDNRQMSSKYGTSLLVNALTPYKRLRMAEDSLLMARATRGVEKYIYKLKVDEGNIEAVDSILDQYVGLLKKARAIDTRNSSPYFDQQMQLMSVMEDIILPVWGDVNDLDIEKIGGDVNVRWIVDVEELRNQLASSLRTPLSLLGGYVQESTGALGATSLEKLDIRFARSSRRLQRAVIEGITRLCQVHLSYLGLDPDTKLFKVNMPETSTAEEQDIVETLSSSVDAIAKFMDMLNTMEGVNFDKEGIVSFLSNKILKIGDFHIEDYVKEGGELLTEAKKGMIETAVEYISRSAIGGVGGKYLSMFASNGDFRAYTYKDRMMWESCFKDKKVKTKFENVSSN